MSTYKDSGVDIDTADAAKKEMRKSIDTGDKRVLNTLGAFASLVEGSFPGYKDPVLALKTEEPGTKQKLAFQHGYVKSICFDTVNHLINDIAVMGATPLYVQDLIICGKLEKSTVTEIVAGFSEACKEQGCVLTGGETTEQPGVLEAGVYALAASVVGVVERSKIIDGSKIEEGDVVLALESSGLHTNGYSLARKLLAENASLAKKTVGNTTFLDALMKPHTCYYKALKTVFDDADLHGLAHITGGGMQGNINRILPKKLAAKIDLSSLHIPEVFSVIRSEGKLEDEEMLRTFNMGVGVAAIVSKKSAERIAKTIEKAGHKCYPIGSIISGKGNVEFTGALKC